MKTEKSQDPNKIDKELISEEAVKEMREDTQKRLQEEYKQHSDSKASGIFKKRKRQQLLGLFKPKKERTKREESQAEATFWWRTRNQVRTSLIDLALFVRTANKENIDQAITAKTLEPFAIHFFHIVFPDQATPERARVASLLVRNGLTYLAEANKKHMDSSRQTAIHQVLSLVDFLVGYIERGENK